VAGHAYLNKLSAIVRRDALERLEDLLPDDAGDAREQEALVAAQRDVVASKDPQFQVYALVGALSRIVARQQEEIDALSSAKDSSSSRSSASRKKK
jgi:hypothetical protein